MSSKDASIRVIWEKNKSNPWAGFRPKAMSKRTPKDDLEEQAEKKVSNNNGAEATVSFEENREDENVKPHSDNTSQPQQDVSSNKREDVSQPNKDAADLARSLSKLKKKIKKPLDGASISIRSSFSCSFGEIMRNKSYKEIVDEKNSEKDEDAAFIENEFDLIAKRRGRENSDGKMKENNATEQNARSPNSVAYESSVAAYKTLEDFLEKKNHHESPPHRLEPEALYHHGVAESIEEDKTANNKTIASESVYTLEKLRSVEETTERTEEQSKYYNNELENSDADGIFFQTSRSQTIGTETYADDQTTRKQESRIMDAVIRGTVCCVTGAGSGLISRAPASAKARSPGSKEIRKDPNPTKDEVDDDALSVELAMHGEKTLIQVDGQQVSDVRFLRGRRVFRLERNKLKGRRFFSSKRVYESVKGKRESLVIPKERSTQIEIEHDEFPQNAQVTRLTKSKKTNKNTGKSVGISNENDVIVKVERASKGSTKNITQHQKEDSTSKKKSIDDVEGYSADVEDHGEHHFSKPISGPSYRHLHPGKSIYWLKVGEGVEKSHKLSNSPANDKSVYWLKVGEEV